jgi:hypothetical protein
VLYFFSRGKDRLACETRLSPMGSGYELVVTTGDVSRVEPFTELAALLAREHELLQAWRAIGWREAAPAPAKPDTGPEDQLGQDWLSRRG